jgi:NADH:ubiquinone oxidoreductase subunit F (NADH-binding)
MKNPGVYEIELGLSVYEFMNSDEYLGGMSSDRPLKALVRRFISTHFTSRFNIQNS